MQILPLRVYILRGLAPVSCTYKLFMCYISYIPKNMRTSGKWGNWPPVSAAGAAQTYAVLLRRHSQHAYWGMRNTQIAIQPVH
jgi:hypothetical protein